MFDWGTEALTFAVDEAGRRFESRNRAPESVDTTAEGIVLRGVVLCDGAGDPVAREDWKLSSAGDEFVWTVERTWLRDVTVTSAGTPALFFSTRPINSNPSTILPNSVATAFWIEPEKLHGWHNPFYRPTAFSFVYKLALANNVVVTEPGGWAVLKLFPAWQHESEPRFAAEGGHLYRRGHFGWLSEVGIVSHPEPKHVHHRGETEETTLRLSAVPATASGHQLAVNADDPSGTIDSLRHFYGALFNGGCVNDQLHYNFGNEPDGWYYGGASWMKGFPLLAGVPAPSSVASRPHDLARAFRDNLPMIAGTEFEPGLTRFGYNSAGHGAIGGDYTDDNIIQIIGGRAYYLYSGDLAFVRQQLPFYRRAAEWYLGKRNADGLVSLSPAHWYYDAMLSSGMTTYHNAFLYRALLDLAIGAGGGQRRGSRRPSNGGGGPQGRHQPGAMVGRSAGRTAVRGLDLAGRHKDRLRRRSLSVPAGGLWHRVARTGAEAARHARPAYRRTGERPRLRGLGLAVRLLARACQREHASGEPGFWQLHERWFVSLHDILGSDGSCRGR